MIRFFLEVSTIDSSLVIYHHDATAAKLAAGEFLFCLLALGKKYLNLELIN